MRSVLALAAVAAFVAWSDSAEAFGKKKGRGCCGETSSCCGNGYGGGYGSGGCSYGYGSGYGHGGCSAVVYAQPTVQAAPAPAAVVAPAQPVYATSYGCSGYGGGYGCSGYGYGGGYGCSNGNDCGGRGHHKNKGRKCCR